ncbi:hypothetical protein L2E82_27243 [Cichorium intybus]|uniref:Uncharacterized protein n=1 Tax=Cichorium intybus TaxID=13427 RepID=A0ACB9CSN2_CICIN|nr:hypothetical protein L2E82_27243 [Cichorium intybus]
MFSHEFFFHDNMVFQVDWNGERDSSSIRVFKKLAHCIPVIYCILMTGPNKLKINRVIFYLSSYGFNKTCLFCLIRSLEIE